MLPKKRLQIGDFQQLIKDYPEAENLVYNLNQTREETSKALDSRLSIKDNMNQELKDIEIADQPITFSTSVRGTPRGVTVVKAEQPCLGGFVNWEYIGEGQIRVDSITGIAQGCNNRFTLLVMGD